MKRLIGIVLTAALTAAVLLPGASAQPCWGAAVRLPVRQAPTVFVTPAQPATLALPADCGPPDKDGWRWSPSLRGYYRIRPAAAATPATPKKAARRKAAPCCGGATCEAGDCPCRKSGVPCGSACRCVLAAAAGDWQTSGVDRDKLDSHPRILHKGREITRAEAMRLVEGKDIPSDEARLRLTVIGAKADRDAVIKDIAERAELAEAREKVAVQAYDPGDWAVGRYGFKTDGKPTIYLQAPDGKVLHRQDEYRGPTKLAEAVRKADPNYRHDKDPDLNKQASPLPSGPISGPLSSVIERLKQAPWYAWALVALAAVLYFRQDRPPRDPK